MKDLIPQNQFGIFAIKDKDGKGVSVISSRVVAEIFGKDHAHVLRDIKNLLSNESGLSLEFRQSNFGQSTYKNKQNHKMPEYLLTKDGFIILAMGYNGKHAMQFKEAYIHHYDEMELQIKDLLHARVEFPVVTGLLSQLNPDGNKFQYSNEANLINKVALGVNAKQFRDGNGIPKGESIRSYLTKSQINLIDLIQNYDQILLINKYDYQERKELLIAYKVNLKNSGDDTKKMLTTNLN